MADRSVSVKLEANISGYMAALRTAGMETKRFAKEVGAATGQQKKDHDLVGKSLLGVGTAALAGLGMATKAAIDWESAWAGVEKTVSGNATQMAQLENDLRELATTLPATHEEIAGIAEAAGALGVKREDIVDFTETMIALGESTDLTADAAANAIARISTVMGTSMKDVDEFGSALVALGNDGASTESEILSMAERIAGAGNQIGLAETDVLGLASALSGVGIEAEAGGSSISTTMVKIATAVSEGGDAVAKFAEVAGMSSDEFTTLFRDDAAEAITVFVEGLGRMQKAGGDVFGTLSELGLSEIRTRDAMLRLAGAGDMLRESLDLGAKAWEENTALTDEAQKRYDTVASKVQVAWNTIKDAAIDVGAAVAPVIGALADAVGFLGDVFDVLPGPIKDALGLLGGLAGIAALAGGAFLLMAPRIRDTKLALDAMGVSLRGVGKAALFSLGPLGALIAIGQTLGEVFGDELGADEIAKVDKELSSLIEQGKFEEAKKQLERYVAVMKMAGEDTSDLTALLPLYSEAQAKAAEEAAILARANYDSASSFDRLLGMNVVDELGRTGEAANLAALTVEELAAAWGIAADDAEGLAKAVDEMMGDWAESFAEFAPILGAYEEALKVKEEAERETAEKTAEATDDSKDSWEDYVGDVTVSVDEYLEQLERMVKDQDEWADNMIDLAGKIPPALLDELADMGKEGAGLVGLLNRMTGKELKKYVQLWEDNGRLGGEKFAQQLAEAGPVLQEISAKLGAGAAKKVRDGMKKHGTDVYTEAKRQGLLIDKGVGVDRKRDVKVDTDGRLAVRGAKNTRDLVNRLLGGISDEPVTVKLGLSGLSDINATFSKLKGLDGKAAGGPIDGPGTGTSDDVLLWGSKGEFMQPTASVDYYGLDFMEAVRTRRFPRDAAGLPGFAAGGEIRLGASIPPSKEVARYAASIGGIADLVSSQIGSAVQSMFDGLSLSGPALGWAQSQEGKPYGWGAVGPDAYDCSGFMSAITNILLGRSPHSRIGSTGTFPWSMFAPGSGRFTIGSFRGNPGHMAGTLDNVNVESRGVDGVVVGPEARGANSAMFTTRGHLKGYADGGPIEGDAPWDLIDPRGMYTQGFRYGTRYVPWDGMYQLHRGEEVRPRAGGSVKVELHFNGPVGSQYELEQWLVKSMDRLKESNRV